MSYIVELEMGVFVAPWLGDPGRTLVKEKAMEFKDETSARVALGNARDYREFSGARIIEISKPTNGPGSDEYENDPDNWLRSRS